MSDDHRGRVEACFHEACDLKGDAREHYLARLAVTDPALATEVRDLLAHDGSTGDGFLAPPVPESEPDPDPETEDVSQDERLRFRRLREHARGGLGRVYVAEDRELRREVALKVIRPGRAHHSADRSRFLVEAEITGRLEHPGVVPVYGLGTYADGRPYYAMRLIEGETLDAAIRAHHDAVVPSGRVVLGLRALLVRFVAVCNTVAYAHSRGVIHRDLKPGNIMLGSFGETVVVDWGLAKVLGRVGVDPAPSGHSVTPLISLPATEGVDPTVDGTRLGTPAYMSPEQARGDIAAVGPASDIYSLGVTLLQILTGRPNGASGLPVKVPRPLEAVVHKATAADPASRYASAQELGRDVECWLADEPVSTYRDPVGVRIARGLRRHRTVVVGVAATVVVGFVSLGVFAVVVGEKNRALRIAIAALDRERRASSAREELATSAIGEFREAVVNSPELHDSPAFGPLRDRLLGRPLNFYQTLIRQLRSEPGQSRDSRERLVFAMMQLAETNDEIGDAAVALKGFEEARELASRLASEEPTAARYAIGLTRCDLAIGRLLLATGHPDEAVAVYRRYLQGVSDLRDRGVVHPELHVNDASLRQDQADANISIGNVETSRGNLGEAIRMYREALAIAQALRRDHPEATGPDEIIAMTQTNLAYTLRELDRTDEAIAALEEGDKAYRTLMARSPDDVRFVQGAATLLNNLGVLLKQDGRMEAALETYARCLVLRGWIADRSPSSTEALNDLSTTLSNLGNLQKRLDRLDDALESQVRALAIREELHRRSPAVLEFRQDLAASLLHVGNLWRKSRGPRESLELYERARRILVEIVQEQPRSPDSLATLGVVLGAAADAEQDIGNLDRTRELLRESIGRLQAALEISPDHPVYQEHSLDNQLELAEVALAAGDPVEALKYTRGWVQAMPTNPDARFKASTLIAGCIPLSDVDSREELATEAIRHLRDAFALGWSDRKRTASDPLLESIRSRPEYQELIRDP